MEKQNAQIDMQLIILSTLATSEDGCSKIIPYTKADYFETDAHKYTFKAISAFFSLYKKVPTRVALEIMLAKLDVSQELIDEIDQIITQIYSEECSSLYLNNPSWVLEEAESYFKNRALYIAVTQSIKLIDTGKVGNKQCDRGMIVPLMQEALSVSFNKSIGHGFIDDAAARFDFYHKKEVKFKTGIDTLDAILQGGFTTKTLNIIVGGTGTGKTSVLCGLAALMYTQGHNCLYISCEMAEERIAERIDANLLDVKLEKLKNIDKATYLSGIGRIKERSNGKLMIKEYPPSTATCNHFRALLKDLEAKKGFVPKIIFVDYLAIVASSSVSKRDNMYLYAKSVAEEIRALAVEHDAVVICAAQTNRDGQNDMDMDVTQMGESHGISATADLILAIIRSEQLDQLMQLKIKQLKNRYGPEDNPRSFNVGLDRSKMKIYNVMNAAMPAGHYMTQAQNQHHSYTPSEGDLKWE